MLVLAAGVAGILCIVAGIAFLAGPWWALIALGIALLLGAVDASIGQPAPKRRRRPSGPEVR